MSTLLPADDAKDTVRPTTRNQRRSVGTAVSLFSGAGGLDVGLEAAGWELLLQVEMNLDCIGTLSLRNKARDRAVEICPLQIEDLCPAEVRRGLALDRGELSLLAGGPPCQPFTTSGLRRALSDRRASALFPAYLGLVEELFPRALLIENVDGMLSAALRHRPLVERGDGYPPLERDEMKGSFLHWLITQLGRLGYSVSWGVVEAADHGVPQLRQRAVLIAMRGNEPCFLPEPAFGRPGLPLYRTLSVALADVTVLGPVQPLSRRKRLVYQHIPAGGNWRDLSDEMRRETMGAAYHAEGGKSGWWRRLSWNAPAPTILGMPDHSSTALVHPDEVRCLSVNECAAIQTFPAGSRFAGTPRSQYQQIGNAVPPALAACLGQHLASFMEGERTPAPGSPPWRKVSANRRIGTHGWATPGQEGAMEARLTNVRPDHVWRFIQDAEDGREGEPCRQRPEDRRPRLWDGT